MGFGEVVRDDASHSARFNRVKNGYWSIVDSVSQTETEFTLPSITRDGVSFASQILDEKNALVMRVVWIDQGGSD